MTLGKKIREFVKLHNAINRYYEGTFQRFKEHSVKQKRGIEKIEAGLDEMETLKALILRDVDKEIERLETLKQVISSWKKKDSEFINLEIIKLQTGNDVIAYSLYHDKQYQKLAIIPKG